MKKQALIVFVTCLITVFSVGCTSASQSSKVSETTSVVTTSKASSESKPQNDSKTTDSSEESSDVSTEPEHKTSAYVDYIALKAKADAENATDEEIEQAITWLKDNTSEFFKGEENMEKVMYYGELLEYKYKGTGDDLEKIGWQAFKTVKYVYRGAETIEDTATRDNLKKLKKMLEEYK